MVAVAMKGKNKALVPQCPFSEGDCDFPDGEHFKSENFVGCKVVDYSFGNEVVHWVCPRFPVDMSITAVREAFMRMAAGK